MIWVVLGIQPWYEAISARFPLIVKDIFLLIVVWPGSYSDFLSFFVERLYPAARMSGKYTGNTKLAVGVLTGIY